MREALARWRAIYEGAAREGHDPALRLGYTIVRKLSRAVFSEYVPVGDLPHQQALELAMISGESYLKPVLGHDLRWLCVDRGDILIFSRDLGGEPTDVALLEKQAQGRHWYTLLERRTLQGELLTVSHRLYRSASPGELGREVALSALDCYRDLPRQVTVPTPGGVGLIRVKMPMHNCVDGSREGVSIYAAAEDLIAAADRNEFLLKREFENGASRLVVSRDLLDRGQLKDELFVALDDSPETVGITVFNPQLREGSYLNRQQAYLRALENVIGLKRGLLSQVEAVDRTATEITSSEGEYMTTILELRRAWEDAARQALELGANLTGQAFEAPVFQWGDGVV
jgi:hypothetical protein